MICLVLTNPKSTPKAKTITYICCLHPFITYFNDRHMIGT